MAPKLGQFALAAETYLEVHAGQQARKPNDWSTFATQFKLGASLAYLKKFGEAEAPLLAAFSGLESQTEKIPEELKFYLTLAAKLLLASD